MNGPPPEAVPDAAGQDISARTEQTAGGTILPVRAEAPGPECLYSNLIKVSFPDEISTAETPHRFARTLWEALRRSGGEVGPEWVLGGKQLTSFRDLRTPPWNAVCNQKTLRRFPTGDWADSDDPDRCRDFVRLLNHCLRGLTDSLDLWYSKRLDCYYFAPTPDMKPRNLVYRSFQKETNRDVFAVFQRTDDPNSVWYCRHFAFQGAFRRLEGQWYLEVTPTYVFTSDGSRLSGRHSDLIAGLKRLEGNAAVAGQVVMWGDFLARKGDMFRPEYPYLSLGKIERFQVPRGIDDAAWMSRDSTEQGQQEGGLTQGLIA